MNLLILNGPNLNLLGLREPAIYGRQSYADLVLMIQDAAARLGVSATVRQSNHEGTLVDEIQAAYGVFDGIVFNPAAYTHTSVALLDAVEVHISDVSKREDFRQVSFVRQACIATIAGHGLGGYIEAMELLKEHLTA